MLESFMSLGICYLLAAIVPGPSFSLVLYYGLTESRLTSIVTALGVIVGTSLQTGIVLISFCFIKMNSIVFLYIKVLCSIYLMYLGIKMFSKGKKEFRLQENRKNSLPIYKSFFEGFLIEVFNPLAFSFFLSIICLFVDSSTTYFMRFLFWIEIIICGMFCFITLAMFSSSNFITLYSKKHINLVKSVSGVLFLVFGSNMCYVSVASVVWWPFGDHSKLGAKSFFCILWYRLFYIRYCFFTYR